MKKLTTIILCIVLMVFFTSCNSSQSTQSSNKAPAAGEINSKLKTITDTSGAKVEIPTKINKIADSWKAHNEVLSVLGAGDKIAATVLSKKSMPWLYKVNPAMEKAVTTFGANFNTEDLMKNKPDVVFVSSGDANANKISSLGIPVVQLNFTTFDTMKKCVSLTGEILGEDATKRADKYNKYLDDKVKMVKDVTSKIPGNEKPKVLHVESLSPIGVDGSKTIINEWIETAGGVNAAKDVTGNMKEVSLEQVMQWNPDIIIFGANGSSGKVNPVSNLLNDPNWQKIAAVKNGRVYQNPVGAFLWDRYSCEEALQVQWAAKTIHPDKFKDLDIAAETKNFYKTFLNYDLTNEDVDKILKAQPPTQ